MPEAEVTRKWLHTQGELEYVHDTLGGLSTCSQLQVTLFVKEPFGLLLE